MTPAEAALWQLLRGSNLNARKFRRQHSLGPYIMDFYCPAERLAVELDGAAHDTASSAAMDHKRDQFLRAAGITVLRIENRQVFDNPDEVLALIAMHFKK